MLPAARSGGHDSPEWTGEGVLRVHTFGQEWSVWRWLSSTREWSEHFYVNLEDPWRRTSIGYDSGDWELDLVGTPDSWVYKDEDELRWSEEIGLVGSEWAMRTREAGRRASKTLEANEWPFNENWDRWLPPIDLPIPVLAADWNVVKEPGTGV